MNNGEAPQLTHFTTELIDDGRVLEVALDRPPVNALTWTSYQELQELHRYVTGHPSISVLLLVSRNRVFCAGADTKALSQASESDAARRRDDLRKTIRQLHNFSVPVVTAVNGAAVGAGAVLAAAGDVVMVSDEAFIALPEVDINLIGGARALARIVAPPSLRDLALTGRRMYGEEMYRLGVAQRLVEAESLHQAARTEAAGIAAKGYHTARKWKEALNGMESTGLDEGMLLEQALSLGLTALRTAQ